ncbi:hypothetical protein [Phenylobacterium sp. J426]|nr:hypothetical protein [Phenylobacterium sp. J426]
MPRPLDPARALGILAVIAGCLFVWWLVLAFGCSLSSLFLTPGRG